MRRSPIRLAAFSLGCLLWSLCGCEETNSPGRQFSLIVEVDGEGIPEVTQIQIRGGSFGPGEAWVRPRLPFARLLQAAGEETVEVEIDGRALDGIVRVRLRDDPALVADPQVYAEGECGPGIPVCNLVVSNTF